MSALWGLPDLFIKVAVDDGVPPAFVAWSRVVLAAVVLLALAWRAGALGSLRGTGRWLAAYAFLEISIPFPMIAFGEQHVASSLAAIIIASVPLFIALLAIRFDDPSARPAAAWWGCSWDSAAWSRSSGSTWPAAATSCSARERSCSPRWATRPGR